jgi:hypothetical protein
MNLYNLFFNFTTRISKFILGKGSTPRTQAATPAAPVLGKYRDEVSNTELTEERTPVRSAFTKSPEHYAEMLHTAVSLFDNTPSKGDAALIYECRVHAEWGLIYSGAAAIPFAIDMLKSRVAEAREAGAGILGAIGKDERVVQSLLESLGGEVEAVTRDSIILALGQLRNRKAIPALASIIKDANADGNTRHTAADSLGSIVKRRFDKQPDRIAAAIEWLDSHKDATG